ncbi:dipeptidyl peptidase IV [Gemmatimonadetes bacterium T265]|nr:dipeptidyl peptidase IV [Gemmatimonadetes bacterium T265]
MSGRRLSHGPRGAAVAGVLALGPLGRAGAQPAPRALADSDYARAERFMAWNVVPLVSLPGRPSWLADGRLAYRAAAAANAPGANARLVVVDPARGTADTIADPAAQQAVARAAGALPERRDMARSPDGRRVAFVRDYNLWVRDSAGGNEVQLTTDGVKDDGYATDNAGWVRSGRAVVLWSADSKKIVTFQQDDRAVGDFYLVRTTTGGRVGHPQLEAWKYPFVGDSAVSTIRRVVIDLSGATPRVIPLQLAPDAHRSTLCDHIVCGGRWADVEWSPDASRLAFVSTSRDHKRATLRVADAATGAVRDVFTETTPTFYESGYDVVTDRPNWRVLWGTNEVLWFSERDDWGQLYLYDLATGRVKRQVTTGPGDVAQVLAVDERARSVLFTAVGREPGRDPYFRHLYRASLDRPAVRLLSPEDADHEVALAPDGRHVVDSYSRPDVPPTLVVRDAASGRVTQTLARGDVSRLAAAGWTPPVPFTTKARDGRTDLYGLLYRPTAFDSTRRYPVVVNVYPGPQVGSVGSRSFSPVRGDARAMAELGFVVVQLDALGTPLRSKTFHAAYAADMGDNGIPDQVAAVRQLAARYPWVDSTRVGVWGHSGGGYATAAAMLRFPDFFKAGVSEAGNHDNRLYEDDWGEKWTGLEVRNADGTTNYDAQANQLRAGALKGHLLLAYGTADDNVPPDNSLALVDALVAANKDVDVLPLPNRRHGFGGEPYMIRRRWDYFVRYLLGAEPPREYRLHAAPPVTPVPNAAGAVKR